MQKPDKTVPTAGAQALLDRVRERVARAGLTQADLAKSVGVTRQYMSMWLSGNLSRVSPQMLRGVAETLKLDQELLAALVKVFAEGGRLVGLEADLAAQEREGSESIWVISSRFIAGWDTEFAKRLGHNLNKGIEYVLWSPDEVELRRVIDKLASEQVKTERLALAEKLKCVKGPEWLAIVPYRVTTRGGFRTAEQLRRQQHLPVGATSADSHDAEAVVGLLGPVLERLLASRDGLDRSDLGAFKLVHPARPAAPASRAKGVER